MINVRTIRKMKDFDSIVIKNGAVCHYKTGYLAPVADAPVATSDEAITLLKALQEHAAKIKKPNVIYQITYCDNDYHVRIMRHVKTKAEAQRMEQDVYVEARTIHYDRYLSRLYAILLDKCGLL